MINAEILIADSQTDANLYYASGFWVGDPVCFAKIGRKTYLLLNDLEIDRGRKEAKVDVIVSLSDLQKKFKKESQRAGSTIELFASFLKEKKVEELILPYHFPAYSAAELAKKKFKITFRPDPFWKKRIQKTEAEKQAIQASLASTAAAISKAYTVLQKSKIKQDEIYYEKEPLSSERLRRIIDLYLLENDCLPNNTIVAGGEQAVDPHDRGSGILNAHRPIVMDVFPRSMRTHYYADMTRTVVKGRATDEIRKLWETVKEAQERAIDKVRAGINVKVLHAGVLEFFESKGYKTGLLNGRMQGFFHGTGHGLGLDIHEDPRVGNVSLKLKAGMVITVEPGLYYAGLGGVRIEDVVYVTENGCEVLSDCPKILEVDRA